MIPTQDQIDGWRQELLADIPHAPQGEALIRRYRANYHLPPDVELTEAMALYHWHLERELTRRLRNSTPENRPQVFADAYFELYDRLHWLNHVDEEMTGAMLDIVAGDVLGLLGPAPKRILEVGAGNGGHLRRLAQAGHECVGSDLSENRVLEADDDGILWLQLDAVELRLPPGERHFDAVLSFQMLEHLHPDDVQIHFESVHRCLVPGGMYIFTSPHPYLGPADVSDVFGAYEPMGMHLKEHTYAEVAEFARAAGFMQIGAGFRWPRKASRLPGMGGEIRESSGYLDYLRTLERILAAVPQPKLRRRLARAFKPIVFKEAPVVAYVPQS